MIREVTWPQIIHLILNDTHSGLFSARWRVRPADIIDSWQMFIEFDVEKIPGCDRTRSIGGYLCGGRQFRASFLGIIRLAAEASRMNTIHMNPDP
jgi:hypothetical protein